MMTENMHEINMRKHKVLIIGAGLAGCEAAYFLAQKGVQVELWESKRLAKNPAQKISDFAELVCTNSLKSLQPTAPHGMLKYEMEKLGSLVLEMAKETAVPAGDALAVDRELFSSLITKKIESHPLIKVVDREMTNPIEAQLEAGADFTIVASGPLTTSPLEEWIKKEISLADFYFYDAIAPIVDGDTLDYSKLYRCDRYKDKKEDEQGEVIEADYLNAPFNKEEYFRFIEAITTAEKVPPKNFEKQIFFESCLPIDVMVERGPNTARFSCMKPKGLPLPSSGREPYAVVQLRKENLLGAAYNLVGFQTRLTYPEQKRIFRLIPGLENAEFIHYGSVHRNSFLHAKKLLKFDFSSQKFEKLHFAGQMTGVEGYTESAMSGLYVAWQVWRKLRGLSPLSWPVETAFGALVNFLMTAEKPVPSNINLGLMPPVEIPIQVRKAGDAKKYKKEIASERARNSLDHFLITE